MDIDLERFPINERRALDFKSRRINNLMYVVILNFLYFIEMEEEKGQN